MKDKSYLRPVSLDRGGCTTSWSYFRKVMSPCFFSSLSRGSSFCRKWTFQRSSFMKIFVVLKFNKFWVHFKMIQKHFLYIGLPDFHQELQQSIYGNYFSLTGCPNNPVLTWSCLWRLDNQAHQIIQVCPRKLEAWFLIWNISRHALNIFD